MGDSQICTPQIWHLVFGGTGQSGNSNRLQVLNSETRTWTILGMTRLLYSPWPKSFHTSLEAPRNQLYVFSGGKWDTQPLKDWSYMCLLQTLWSQPKIHLKKRNFLGVSYYDDGRDKGLHPWGLMRWKILLWPPLHWWKWRGIAEAESHWDIPLGYTTQLGVVVENRVDHWKNSSRRSLAHIIPALHRQEALDSA